MFNSNSAIFATPIRPRLRLSHPPPGSTFGELAQLARALAWHARGRRFDSDILHKAGLLVRLRLFAHPQQLFATNAATVASVSALYANVPKNSFFPAGIRGFPGHWRN